MDRGPGFGMLLATLAGLVAIPFAELSFAEDSACGTVVRLDDSSGDPLQNAMIQSQDGLGTCASNTLSLLLQAELPGHPAVSFLDIAFHDPDVKGRAIVKYGELNSGAAGDRRSQEVLAFSGENVCTQFFQLKSAKGGVCRRETVPLESAEGEAKAGQVTGTRLKEVLEAAGRLFDLRDQGGIGQAFRAVDDAVVGQVRWSCGMPRSGHGVFREALLAELALRRSNGETGLPTESEVDAISGRFYEEMSRLIGESRDAKTWVETHAGGVAEVMKAVGDSLLPTQQTSRLVLALNLEIELMVRLDPLECAKRDWEQVEASLRAPLAPTACVDPALLNPALALSRAVSDLGWDLDEIQRKVTLGSMAEDATDFFETVIAPACSTERIPIPDGLFCSGDWLAPQGRQDRSGAEWKSAAGEFRRVVEQRLNANTPLGLTICSEVLNDFSIDSFNGTQGCPGQGTSEHSSHALTAIGYRDVPVQAGGCRREILLQNSWGLDWCAKHGAACDNGKLWIPEEALVRNVIRADSMKSMQRRRDL